MDNTDTNTAPDPTDPARVEASDLNIDPHAAAPSDNGTPVSQDEAGTTAPQRAGEPAAPAAETVVGLGGVATQGFAGDTAAAVNTSGIEPSTLSMTITGDMDFVRARLHTIELHALTWGGEIGTAIRNEVGALMDHLGVSRPQ